MWDEIIPLLTFGFIMKALDAGIEHVHYRQVSDRLAELMATIGALSARLDAVESGAVSGESVQSAVDTLSEQIAEVKAELETKQTKRGAK